MIAFVVALKSEAKGLIEKLENKKEIKLLDKFCYEGTLNNKQVVVAISGIGKVSAGLTAQCLIDRYNPEYIFNFGTCGGISKDLEIASYYIIDRACQFDFDITEIDDVTIGYIQEYDRVMFDTFIPNNCPLNRTSLATADRFSNKQIDIDNIQKLGCSVRDMEGGAIAQVCQSNNVPFISIKGITDIYGNPASQFFENLEKVCNGFYNIILQIFTLI